MLIGMPVDLVHDCVANRLALLRRLLSHTLTRYRPRTPVALLAESLVHDVLTAARDELAQRGACVEAVSILGLNIASASVALLIPFYLPVAAELRLALSTATISALEHRRTAFVPFRSRRVGSGSPSESIRSRAPMQTAT